MSRYSYSVLARTALGLGFVLAVILLSSALVSAQTGATTSAATAVAPGATLTPLPTLPPAVSETPAPTLPAYPFPVTTVPPPTPWPTATLPSPSPTPVVTLLPVMGPPVLPTIQPPAPPPVTPDLPPTYPPGQLNRLTRLARAQGRHAPGSGGRVVSGPVDVSLPGNASGRPLRLDLYTDTTYRVLPSGLLPEAFFSLDLTDETDGQPAHHLDRPAEVRIDLGGLGRRLAQPDALVLVHYDAATDQWDRLPTRRQGVFLIGDVSDFSALALAQDVGADWQPSPLMDVADTDLFSGAASFTIPIEVPQGTHGLAPKLALTYSSTVPDGMDYAMWKGPGWDENKSSGSQANWVGLGWNLGLGQITSKINPAYASCDHNDESDGTCPVPTYTLELNGVQESLKCVGGDCDNARADWLTFETKRASFMKIVRRLDLQTYNNRVPNAHHMYFEVWDKSGTYYRFGWTENSEHMRGAHQYPNDYYHEAWALSLDLVQDPFGNRMEIDYFEDNDKSSLDSGSDRMYTRAAYPARIRYTYNENAGGLGAGVYHREVRFNEALWSGCNVNPRYSCGWTNGVSTWTTQNRSDFTGDNSQYRYTQRYKLDDIISYVRVDGVNYPFRRYQFGYQVTQPVWDDEREESDGDIKLYERQGLDKILLNQVTETGFGDQADGQGVYPASARYGATPSYQFTYWPTTVAGQPKRLQMQTVTSALGGTVTWSYGEYLPCHLNDSGDCNQTKIKRWRVIERTADPHTFASEVMRQRYVYGRPWDYEGAVGHEWARALTDSTGNGNDWQWPSVHHVYMTPRKNAELLRRPDDTTYPSDWYKWLWGREMQTETRIGRTSSADAEDAGVDVKGRVIQVYDLSGTGESREVRHARTLTYRAPEQTGSLVDIGERAYGSYGNVLIEYECPDKTSATAACAATGAFARETQRWYETLDSVGGTDWGQPGSRRYIVDKVIVEGVHGVDPVGSWWPQVTYYSYDDRTGIPWLGNDVRYGVAGPTDKGKLTMVRRLDCWRCSPETTADTRYDYDSLGNVTTTTTWDQFASNGTAQGVSRAVTTTYDATKTFVTRVTQPGGSVWEQADYSSPLALRRQQPLSVEDTNGAETRTTVTYDAFGRTLTIQKPGDSPWTEERRYDFNATRGARLMVAKTQRLDATRTMTTRTFYDGLGRAVLSKAPHPDGNGTASVVATYYGSTGFGVDPRGVKTAETLPTGGALDDSYSRPTLTASYTMDPRLIYTYDGLGGLTRTTRPDQSVSLVTPIREQRGTSLAERGPEFGLPASLNASFEDQGVANFCAAGWPCVAGVVDRVGTGVDGRFALRVSGANPSATATYPAGTIPSGATYSLSWLARRTSDAVGTLTTRVMVNGVSVTVNSVPATSVITASAKDEWTLYHWTFQAPATSGSQLAISFEVPTGLAYEVDNVRLSWGEVRERVETADGLGRTVTVAERQATTTWLKTQTTYDPIDRVLQVTDPTGQTVTTTSYNTRLWQQTVVDSDRGAMLRRYDPQGNLVKQQDARGQWLTLCYDSLDRLTAKHYADVSTCASPGRTAEASYSYDDATATTYRKGRRWQMTDSGGTQVTWSYDARGRVTTETRRIASWDYPTSYSYNSADLATGMTYPDGEVVTTSYNGAGQVSGVSGTSPYLTSQTYDVGAKPLITTLGSTGRTERTYDSLSQRLTTLRREVRAPFTYTAYDEARPSYSYDWFGNVLSLSDAVTPSESQTFSYDALNRLVGVTGPYAQAFAYDDRGNLTRRGGDVTSQQQYLYTAGKAHAVSHVGIDASAPPRFRYDQAGHLTDRGCSAATGSCVQSLTYDAEGRLTDVKEGATARESFAYDGDGALVRRTSPTSAAAIQFTETFGVPSSAWTTGAASTWGVNTNDGHVTTLRTIGASNWTTTAARTATVAHGQTVRVAFKVSQTSSQAVLALDTGSGSTYHRFGVYENGGKLYQATAASTSGGTSYVNPTVLVDSFAAGVWYVLELMVDDGAGDRVSVWRADTPSERFEARWELPANRAWTFRHWAFAGTTWLDDYQELRPGQAGSNARIVGKHYEYDSVSASQTKRYYANGQLLATRTGTTLRYVQGDHLGSTTTLTDGGGVVVSKERYAAFGERRRTSDKVITDQLYTGQRLNVLSGLYHYSDGTSAGRFYDPLLARFVQADSVTPGTTSIALNRYAYANNSPLRYSDPNGHFACTGSYEGPFVYNIRACLYRMGFSSKAEVQYRDHMVTAAQVNDVPEILIAAAILRQSDPAYPDRIVGDMPERWLMESGRRPDQSVGLGQITPAEARRYGGSGTPADLFDPARSIGYMGRKLGEANAYINTRSGWTATDRFMLLGIAQNEGLGTVKSFFESFNQNWSSYLFQNQKGGSDYGEQLRSQLWAMLQKVEWLLWKQEGWQLPEGVDLDEYRRRLAPSGEQP